MYVNEPPPNRQADLVLTVCLIFASSALATCDIIRKRRDANKRGCIYVAKRTICPGIESESGKSGWKRVGHVTHG